MPASTTDRVRFLSLVFSGLCAAFAGIIYIAFLRSFNPSAASCVSSTPSAAVIIGGGSIFGGHGTVLGSLAGAAVIALMRALLSLQIIRGDGSSFVMPQHWVNVFIGFILIGAVLADIWARPLNFRGMILRMGRRKEAGACLKRDVDADHRDARHQQGVRARAGAGGRRPDALSGRGDRAGRRQFAGKSTLMKILTGAYSRDSGEILVGGEPVHFKSPNDSRNRGIEMIYQDFALCGNMNVAQNIFLGRWPRKGTVHRPQEDVADADEVLTRLKVNVNSVYQKVESLSGGASNRGHRPRHLLQSARRDPRRADRQPFRSWRPSGCSRPCWTEAPGRRADHHLAPLTDIFAVGDRVMVLKRGENVGDRYIKNTGRALSPGDHRLGTREIGANRRRRDARRHRTLPSTPPWRALEAGPCRTSPVGENRGARGTGSPSIARKPFQWTMQPAWVQTAERR
jgi:simple sugar transport system ATP-binding protein